MADETKNVHKGHRARLKSRFLSEGLDNFNQHQVLELLLFYTIPLKDTNETAHELLNTFGSISKVMNASIDELKKVNGISEHSASLITMIPQLSRIYSNDLISDCPRINNSVDACKYVKNFFVGRLYEVFFLLCMDNSGRVIHTDKIGEGSLDETPYYPRHILETAFRHNAKKVIFAHNHPSDILNPSNNDIEITHKLVALFEGVDIEVVDHIIVGKSGCLSMKEIGCLRA